MISNIDTKISGQSGYSKILKRISILACIVLAAYYISTNWYQLLLIQGESMNPTYHNMQLVIIDRHSKDYDYGDVISFECNGLDAVLVKRIVACPGDTVVIDDGTLYVNGNISEVFMAEGLFVYAGEADTMVLLEKGQYFVIGDNVSESKDSRYAEVGCIYEIDILGKIVD